MGFVNEQCVFENRSFCSTKNMSNASTATQSSSFSVIQNGSSNVTTACNLVNLPHNVLDRLVCCECKGKLSSGPVKVKLDGGSICGKCSLTNTFSAPMIEHVAFNELVKVVKFPCKYEYLGCIENIRFDDVVIHENTCSFKSHYCPTDAVTCLWSGTLAQIPEHFRKAHSELILEKPSFVVDHEKDSDDVRLFIAEGLLFLIKSKVSLFEKKVWIKVEYAGVEEVATQLKYKVVLYTGVTDGLQMMLKERSCHPYEHGLVLNNDNAISVDIKSLLQLLDAPDQVICNIYFGIPDKVILQKDRQLCKIVCPNCKVFMSPPIYQCENGHVTCFDCTGYKSICKMCKKMNVKFARVLDFEVISATNQLPCRWKYCGKFLNYAEIRQHEKNCTHKSYKCPRCTRWYGVLDELDSHFAKVHDTHPIFMTNEMVVEGAIPSKDFYFLTFGEIFGCSIFSTDEDRKNASVFYYGSPGFCDVFSYVVEMRHARDPEFKGNKVYSLEKCSSSGFCSSYNLKIPREDIKCFESDSDYNIVIKIVESVKTY